MRDIPSSTYDGAMERTADGGVIRFVRHLAHPIREVWDGITNPERLADWWLPFDADIAIDLREGGQMVMAARGDGMSQLLRVQNFGVSQDGYGAGAGQSLERPFGHADPGDLFSWAGATASRPNRPARAA